MLSTNKQLSKYSWISKFAIYSVGALAFSINFGVALVSISGLLIAATVCITWVIEKTRITPLCVSNSNGLTPIVIPLALVWMTVTGIWTESNLIDSGTQLMRYSRILVIPFILFLIRTPNQTLSLLKIWIFGQIFVIFSSYLLWFNINVPWATNPHSSNDLTPFTSTLEQPIMNTIMFIVVWNLRDLLTKIWNRLTVNIILIATAFEVLYVMQGRTGYVCMVIALTFIAWQRANSKLKIFIIFIPVFLFSIVYFTSSKFNGRITEVIVDIQNYSKGSEVSSQGNRIEFTRKSIEAIKFKPILGYGIGSWPLAYRHVVTNVPTVMINGTLTEIKADNPHEQYLLWFVEGGLIGFILLILIFYAIYRDSKKLAPEAKNSLQLILLCTAFICFLNCPLLGAGMSEYLCFSIAILLNISTSSISEMHQKISQPSFNNTAQNA